MGGTISSDTVWNPTDSPYILTTNLQVAYGANLFVEPDVVIRGNGYRLTVSGNLIATGVFSAPIVITNLHITPQSHISTQHHSILIRFSQFHGGSIYSPTGNGIYGNLVLEDSVIEKTEPEISLWYPVGDCSIQRNIFLRGGGVSVGTDGSVRVWVLNNIFWQQTNSYWEGAVENWASYDASQTKVVGNSFLSTDRVALRLPPGHSSAKMVATNNFWNVTDTNIINGMIFDKRDDTNSADFIEFRPFLSAPDPKTPVVPPPSITAHPQTQDANPGTNLTFSVVATGIGNLDYQWQFNGTNLAGQTNATLRLNSLTTNQAGAYRAIVGNFMGLTATSAVATLTVNYSLTVTTTPYGSVRQSPDSPAYPPGSLIRLTAVAEPGYAFIRWLGDASGTSNPLEITMSANKNITAVFAPVMVLVASNGIGTVTKSPDKALYTVGEQVALVATAGRWHRFAAWSDGNTNNPRLVTIDESNSGKYTAEFVPAVPLETLNIGEVSRLAPVGMPAVLVDGTFAVVNSVGVRGSTQIAVSSTFPNGTLFFTLDGSDPAFSGTLYAGPFTLSKTSLLRTIAYNADFTQAVEGDPVSVVILPTLTAVTDGGGGVAIEPAAGAYFSNSLALVTATPAAGWQFLQWLGDATGTNPVHAVTMTRDKEVNAVFGTALSTTVVGGGTVVVDPVALSYPFGARVRLTAVPADGNYLAFWANAASGISDTPLTFAVTNANPVVTAVFASLGGSQTNSLTVIPNGRGNVTLTPPGHRFLRNAVVVLNAVPDPGQDFLEWSGSLTGSQNPLSVTMTSNIVLTANFTKRLRLQGEGHPELLRHDGFRLTLTGEPGTPYRIDLSTNLTDWTPLTTLTNDLGTVQFTDGASTNLLQRFYRAMTPP